MAKIKKALPTPSAIILEIARQKFPCLSFLVVAADDLGKIDITTNVEASDHLELINNIAEAMDLNEFVKREVPKI